MSPGEQGRPWRLFIAVDVPKTTRAGLRSTLDPLRNVVAGARWTEPRNWHLTLRFLGSVRPALRQWIGEAVSEAAAGVTPFTTRLTELGAFPSAARARVLWAGLEDPGGALTRLAAAVEGALAPEFEPEGRPFSPHLTVARFKEQRALPEGVAGLEVASEPFEVREVVLYRSHLGRPAARYEPLERVPLGGA